MGKVDKKLAFLLMFLLIVGIFLIYAKLNFTGFSIVNNNVTTEAECTTVSGTWTNLTECPSCVECMDEEGCQETCEYCIETWGCSDPTYTTQGDCETATYSWENLTTCDNIISGCVECMDEEGCQETCESCNEVWGCVVNVCDNSHLNLCTDEASCASIGKNWWSSDSTCNAGPECVPNCSGKNCGDNGCGGSCGDCSSGYSCNSGICEADVTEVAEETDNVEIPATTVVTTNTVAETSTSSCTPNWECGEWGECADGTQDRICTDINQCGSNDGMPEATQSCVVEIKETCFDSIKNQDEKGIDCGGLCEKKCGLFTMVGSAISAPIDAGKNFVLKGMFGNATKAIISIASLVLIIGGIAAFVLFKKGLLKLPLIKKVFPKKEEKEDTETF